MNFEAFERKAREGLSLTNAAKISSRLRVLRALQSTYTFDYQCILNIIRQTDDGAWITNLFTCLSEPCKSISEFKASYQAAQTNNVKNRQKRDRELAATMSNTAKSREKERREFIETSVVSGTSTTLDKRMVRSADTPVASEVRTEETLRRALDLFCAEFLSKDVATRPDPTPDMPDPPYDSDYLVFQARIYSIRYDYRVQNIVKMETACANRVSIIAGIIGGDVREATRCWGSYFQSAILHDAANVESFVLLYVLFLVRYSFTDVARRCQLHKLVEQLYANVHQVSVDSVPQEIDLFELSDTLTGIIDLIYAAVAHRVYTDDILLAIRNCILERFHISYGSEELERRAVERCVNLLTERIKVFQADRQRECLRHITLHANSIAHTKKC